MPEVRVAIGGREFEVVCQPGEEHFLRAAAKMLDNEARVLLDQIGRMPETRMLLMAGLMLADKAAGLEDQLRQAEDRLSAERKAVAVLRATPERIEVEVIPEIVTDTLADIAARAEALAAQVDDRLGR